MHKIFSSLLAAIVALSLLTVPASAATFSDVPENSKYYAAVTYLSAPTRTDEDGVIHEGAVVSGTSGGLFSPDHEITIDEFTVMLMHAYYHEDWPCVSTGGKDWAKSFTTTAWQIGVYTEDEYDDMKANGVTRAQVWEMLANVSRLAPYPAWLYTGETPSVDFARDVEYAMYATGLYNEDVDANETPTRGEVAQLIYRLETGDYEKQTADDFWGDAAVTIESPVCWQERNASMYEWTLLPDKYKAAFIKDGWTLRFVEEMRTYYPKDTLACGMTDYDVKTITISRSFNTHKTPVLLHEFGHFIMEQANIPLTTNYMLDTEGTALAELTGSDYCKTDQNEMFAEAFRYVLTHRDNTQAYAEMKAAIPFSLDIIEKGFFGANGLFDFDAFNETNYNYWEYICTAQENDGGSPKNP